MDFSSDKSTPKGTSTRGCDSNISSHASNECHWYSPVWFDIPGKMERRRRNLNRSTPIQSAPIGTEFHKTSKKRGRSPLLHRGRTGQPTSRDGQKEKREREGGEGGGGAERCRPKKSCPPQKKFLLHIPSKDTSFVPVECKSG